MPRRSGNRARGSDWASLVLVPLGLAMLGACSDAAVPTQAPQQPLGLMTSLPLYWPEGTDIADLAAGRAAVPWQRTAIEQDYAIVPLDTLSPIPALSPDTPEVDPLAGLTRLAVIQPRGLSPADNVALDAWVRAGGRLLLALDPALTGDYATPLGDPRRPVDGALIPPVAARWGLAVSFDVEQAAVVTTAKIGAAPATAPATTTATALPLALAGRIAVIDPAAACTVLADGAAATCVVGKGRVTLIADAALFEHAELAGEDGATLRAVLSATLE